MSKETIKFEVEKVSEEQLPKIVAGQVTELNRVAESLKKAQEKSDDAKTSANSAKEKSAGLGHKKEAIEALQAAALDLANAQAVTVEAQKISFEYQKKLGEITKYLFALGCTNMAANRSVVRELKMMLEGASKEQLDELAKEEIKNVIKQLKAQEDILNQQDMLAKKVKANSEKIEYSLDFGEELEKEIKEQIVKNEKQDKILAAQTRKSEEHDRMFREKSKYDKKQDEQIAAQAAKDKEHDRLLAESRERDKKQDEELAAQAAKDKEHDSLLEELRKENETLKELVAENSNNIDDLKSAIVILENSKTGIKAMVLSYIIAIISLIISIIHFFI